MSQWTEAQWRAISARDSNLLVSAGAGAGKTAVLVERIITRILDSKQPVDVDRLLVVTFTNAAAAEMRERVGSALVTRLKQDPTNSFLLRQIALLGKASITTLHSFCLDLMRQFFYHLDLDPGFRVADEAETELIRVDIIESLLERHYTELDEAFCALIQGFGGRNDDKGVEQLILTLADYALSQPEPERWLAGIKENFATTTQAVHELPWYGEVVAGTREALEAARKHLAKARHVALLPEGPAHYVPAISEEIEVITEVCRAKLATWEELRCSLGRIEFAKLPTKKGGDGELREAAKLYRDKAKKIVKEVQGTYAVQSEAQILTGLAAALPQVAKLCDLVKEYFALYTASKRAKGIVDFSDLEHMALSLLGRQGEPSELALELRQKYVEVLVDEYQDINGVQERILTLVSKPNNRFMVGDIKQSIYGFRLAEPRVFRAKEDAYAARPELGECIHLSSNFRSRASVLHAINYLFRQFMSQQGLGGVDYDADALLKPGAEYEAHEAQVSPHVELAVLDRRIVDTEEEEDLGITSREALMVGKKINELMQSKAAVVWDKARKCYRPLSYRDIVILLRATSGRAEAFIDVFSQLGIPAYADTSSGYFQATEVMNMLNLLRIIDNPRQDIPLSGVLRSPFVGLSGEELAHIRLAERARSYWDAVVTLSKTESELSHKLAPFLAALDKWRRLARRGGLPELLWQIYEDTGYYHYVGALPGGRARQANLRALYDRACQYELTSFRGLFRFLRFIERLQEQNGDLGTAKALGENEDVVRIMSIHKSKGLEFPVVFVAGLGNKFNLSDLNRHVLIHREYGVGPQVVDLAARCLYPTLPRLAIRRRLLLDALSEELRVLYVALTRAREKLYLIGSVNDREETIGAWKEQATELDEALLPPSLMAGAKCYLDWMGPACFRHPDLNPGSPYTDGAEVHFAMLEARAEPVDQAPNRETPPELAAVAALKPVEDHGYAGLLRQRFNWVYQAQGATIVPVKLSVSELKRKLALESDAEAVPYLSSIPRRPAFAHNKQGLTPAEVGTAMHMLMQHVDLSQPVTLSSLGALREGMVTKHLLTANEAAAIDLDRIYQFFRGDLGQRLVQSPKVWRELAFSLRIPAKEIHPNVDGEHVYIQGVIDCLFREGGGVVLVDFKNDSVPHDSLAQVLERYKVQIELYARATRELLKSNVQAAYLYLFSCDTAVRVI